MKNLNSQFTLLSLIAASSMMVGFSASAEMLKKSALSVNFNQMIEQTSEERSQLENNIGGGRREAELKLDIEEENFENQKVIDFVDYEVHVQKDNEKKKVVDRNKVVDRRYNSESENTVEEAVRAPNSVGAVRFEAPSEMQVTLVPKTKAGLTN